MCDVWYTFQWYEKMSKLSSAQIMICSPEFIEHQKKHSHCPIYTLKFSSNKQHTFTWRNKFIIKKNHTQTNKIKTLIYFEMKSNDKWTASVSIANVQSKICVNRKCMQYSITPNHTRMPNVQKVAPMFCVRRAWFASPHRSESGVSSVSCSAQWPSSYAITIQFWFGYGRH